MKLLKKAIVYPLLVVLLFSISCIKERSCENCRDNKPPVANAGRDTIIVSPNDTIVLDGSASTDADGTLTSFKWAKVSGPSSSTIVKPASSKTLVKALVTGIYNFELTVRDNGGLSNKDTVQLTVAEILPVNEPPVAKAGPDQEIGLPANVINLDGGSSTDPENKTITYKWAMVSGSSGQITNENAAQTQVAGLSPGIYIFELTVTDAGGLVSKDAVQVSVFACDNSNRPHINVQLIQVGTLSQKRDGMAVATAGNIIVFAGASQSISNGTGIQNYGSSNVDIYDVVTETWSTARLSALRSDVASVAVGNKIFFAGGSLGDGAPDQLFSTVDIYDVTANTWSTASLSEPRSRIAAAAVGNKVFFAGGNIDPHYNKSSDIVDVYDLSTNGWSTMKLSQPREGATAVAVNNKIYFAGGLSRMSRDNSLVSDRIDIYDNTTMSWTTSSLQEKKYGIAGIAVNNKIYWAGGFTGRNFYNSCMVEINNVNTGSTSTEYLYRPAEFYINGGQNAVLKDNKIIFHNTVDSYYGNNTHYVDIYDITSNTWSIGVLPVKLGGASVISVNNTIYLAGGYLNGALSDIVWKVIF